MPQSPQRGCSYGNCPKRAVPGSSYCAEHKRLTDRRYDRFERDPERGRKYGAAWRKARERYARAHPCCERCLEEGRMTPMKEVHHIVPVSQGGTHEQENLMSLCQSCHNKIHHEIGDR